jgi:hypothetical protein
MKTTELFVEQVLIGIVLVFTAVLLAEPVLLGRFYEADFGEFALVAAGAYLVGMIYDRVSDSLLQDVEQHHRLIYALGRYHRTPERRDDDPFPEDALRARLWFSTEAASDYATYLRSRIRLTRALTTLMPAIGVGVVLLIACAGPTLRLGVALGVAMAYAVVFVSKMRRRDPPTAEAVDGKRDGNFELPRTKDMVDDRIRDWYERLIGGYDLGRGRPTTSLLQVLLRRDLSASVALLLPLAAGVACALTAVRPVPVLAAAAVTPFATALCGWTWWRVTQTFYGFLRDHYANAPSAKAT